MLLKLPWLTVDVFADVLGEIPGQFDRRGSRPWPLHVHLTLRFATDFNYLNVLRDAGCFNPGTAPPPEEFAQFIAGIEENIRQGHGDGTISRRC
jgi:hypothetical protein